ncbi:hypothetical protein [Niallia taxi]|uniref:hypothetical protein n=1 Tax=Niallia taxi TaxID=2499688 RepID=UPI0015F6A80C|nr:hypothetical protein [Niallia taxi]
MDLQKLMLYVNILGICLPVALTYVLIVNILLDLPIYPSSIVILALGYVIMIKRNPLFQDLWQKWFRKQ